MKQVLVVDGEGRLAAAVEDRLEPFRAEVELRTVESGEQAFEILAARPADVVVAGLREPCAEPLSLALRAVASATPVGRVLLVGETPPELRWRQLAGGRIRFLGSLSEAGLAETIVEDPERGATGRPEAFGHLEVLDLVRLAGLGRFTGLVRVQCASGDGLLGFSGGRLVSASAGELSGNDAFYQMVLWRGGPAEEVELTAGEEPQPNLDGDVDSLLDEAARFRELLFLVDPMDEPAGRELADGEPQRPPAPGSLAAAWSRLTESRASGISVVLACPGECDRQCCQHLAAHLADELNAPLPSARTPDGGPMFVRLHPAAGGMLTLTFMPCVERNAFLFEALCRTADAVMLCCPSPQASERWFSRVPEGVPVHRAEDHEPDGRAVDVLLSRLAETVP